MDDRTGIFAGNEGRQIRVRGHVTKEDGAQADAYYASRALDSRLGAWASAQSRPLSRPNTQYPNLIPVQEDDEDA